MNDNYAETVDDLADKLREQLDSGDVARVRCNPDISQDEVWEVARNLVGEGYSLSEGYYVFNVAVITK